MSLERELKKEEQLDAEEFEFNEGRTSASKEVNGHIIVFKRLYGDFGRATKWFYKKEG